MEHENTYRPIKAWADDERPREKLLTHGPASLSNAELLAILLGSGIKGVSAVDLARQILDSCKRDLDNLGRLKARDLFRFKGVGKAKAITICAALELGRRRQTSKTGDRPVIQSSRDAYDSIAAVLQDESAEQFWVLILNRANRLLDRECISKGGVSGTVVDAKNVFKSVLQRAGACHLILCHNHPSGNLRPSRSDIRLTHRLVKAGKMMEMPVLDHLIISQKGYYSFADDGQLNPDE